jgi:radical SAM superfamily enzyme YgiQ (UPF0313 family)
MKLTIIQPSHYRSKSERLPCKIKKRRLIGLTLPYLAALTPPGWEVTLIDEQLTGLDFNAPVDLVAVTTWTINSLRAYEIADAFRRRGVPVVMGGPHTYFYPDESAAHCDAVGIGEGETIWPSMLDDFANGRLQKFYHAPILQDLGNLPMPRYALLDLPKYGSIKTYSVQTSRGCPFECEFCSERFYLGHRYRYRPVQDVIEEIRQSRARYVFFADSNFAGRPSHTAELMEALIPLKVHWSALWPAYLCNDRKLMDLAAKSGLLHLNLGMESIDRETLAGLKKMNNKVAGHGEILGNLRKRDISYSLNFIFGWDTEKEDIFASTLAFLRNEKVPAAYFNILTPHKGTPLYDRMLAEDRIIDIDDIGRWPGIYCHIKPRYCTAAELEMRVKAMYHEFYSYSSMLARLPLPVTQPRIASWIVNLEQRKVSREGDKAESFDRY